MRRRRRQMLRQRRIGRCLSYSWYGEGSLVVVMAEDGQGVKTGVGGWVQGNEQNKAWS